MYRTLYCNDICDKHIGQTVSLAGWVDVVRDHGGVIFVDLRDYTGITQVVVHDEELLKNVSIDLFSVILEINYSSLQLIAALALFLI